MDKNALVISKRLKFPYNDRTDKNIIAQPEMNLQSFKGTPDSLKQHFKGSERKLLLGAPDMLNWPVSYWACERRDLVATTIRISESTTSYNIVK